MPIRRLKAFRGTAHAHRGESLFTAVLMSTQAPSHFANLLRQSRFASFDPSIGKVYASYGGHAHRGNWGLKRPLPLRKRKGNITAQAADSIAQQTEWAPAEQQARWIQMWEEVGITPKMLDGPWMEKLGNTGQYKWEVDSEFAPAPMPASTPQKAETAEMPSSSSTEAVNVEATTKTKGGDEDLSDAIPNINSMTDREFERYLEKLREMRPAFLEYLESRTKERGNLWQHRGSIDGDDYKNFLKAKAAEDYRLHDSRVIEQKPQRYGGLVYSPQSLLQSKLTIEAAPGRILERGSAAGAPNSGDYVTSFAGMTPHMHKNNSETRAPLNWRSLGASTDAPDAMRGTSPMRLAYATLLSAPETVQSKPRALRSVQMEMEVYVPARIEHGKRNPYPPGSRQYVAHEAAEERTIMQPSRLSAMQKLVVADWTAGSKPGDNLLNQLSNMLAVRDAVRTMYL